MFTEHIYSVEKKAYIQELVELPARIVPILAIANICQLPMVCRAQF